MTNFNEILEKYRKISFSEHDKGSRFEMLMKNFLLTYPAYREKFSEVWLWNEFPYKKDFGGKDIGIDIVAKTVDGEFWAVQCKCYAETSKIDKPAVDSFLATSSKTFSGEKFSERLWISTTNNWNSEAEKIIQNQIPQVSRISLTDLQNAAVDWEKLDAGIFGEGAVKKYREPLKHQLDAINAAQEYFNINERGKLIMSCGTGKTYTSLKIAEKLFPSGKILFLVPSIALLSQTLSEWSTYSALPLDSICVCSDETASKGRGEDSTQNIDLALPATTDVKKIVERMGNNNPKTGLKVIFSTYQSIERIAEAQKILPEFIFDLIICDEAHRTTGYGTEATIFTKVHENNFISAKKRLYMTATPLLYNSDAKKKANDKNLMLWSMDDEQIYGEEFFHIGFGESVEKNLLSDYKVIVLTIPENNIPSAIQNSIAKNNQIPLDDVAKLVGCINALDKKMDNVSQILAEVDPLPMHKAVAFCSKIKVSEKIANALNELKNFELKVSAEHVDGTMSATKRDKKLSWLKNTPTDNKDCRILTNVRCLSEGVDVPSLDAVLFLSSRKSKVEIVQAVGRVMRKSAGKKYGYIIIPVVVAIDKSPEEVLAESADFGTVWDVLNALRAHDERMDIFIQEISMKKPSEHILIGGKTSGDDGGNKPASGVKPFQMKLNFDELQGAIYARMVERVGNRRYWENWAKDIAKIAERHKQQILQLTDKAEFKNFLDELRQNINPSISEKDAVEMLAQHIITQPVFNALFENYSFAKNNSVSKSMEKILNLLETDSDNEQLEKFYNSVRERCKIATTAEEKQKIIIELYDKFFKTALPLTVERLGIVYTPVEVVDFILHSVNDVLKENFGKTLSDRNVHILDPFTGTGTFITRLIQSGLIRQKDLLRKYQNELHANEIILLAYYIAAINIENTFHDVAGLKDFYPFDGICLTDTFELNEHDGEDVTTLRGFAALQENSERVEEQKNTKIQVIVGNPPYSVGQKSANDNAQNNFYPKLENRIAETYVKNTQATNKNALYDSYIKAFRWASDRIGDSGVIGFVTNAGWLDGAAMDGLRKCFEDEFTSIYVFNLRGNARTSGEERRKEAGNVFGSGSRAPIAITILVKNGNQKSNSAEIYYNQVDDYMSTRNKLDKLIELKSILNDKNKSTLIKVNLKHDWINQRGDLFDKMIILGNKKDKLVTEKVFCDNYSRGIATARDSWCYNFSKESLQKNIKTTISFYNNCLNDILKSNPNTIKSNFVIKDSDLYDENSNIVNTDYDIVNSDYNLVNSSPFTDEKIKPTDNFNEYENKSNKFAKNLKTFIDNFIKQNNDSTKITWVFDTIQDLKRGIKYEFDENKIIECYYRPFIKSNLYYDNHLNQRTYQMPRLFPNGNEENLLICVPGAGVSKDFSVLMTNKITDVQFQQNCQCFPLYYYELPMGNGTLKFDGSHTFGIERHDGVTDYILNQAKDLYGDSVTKEDIFYYVYGFLHLPSYKEKFSAELKKSLPRIILVDEAEKFLQISQAGRELAEIHLNYEKQEFPDGVEIEGAEFGDFKIKKLRFISKDDRSILVYNDKILIKNIPAKSFDYVVNGRSPLEWIIDRYQVKTDSASGIENNPNDWCSEHGDEKYILNLILSCITVSLKTLEIVENLPEVDFEE